MTYTADEAGLPVGHTADKSHAKEKHETPNDVPHPGKGVEVAREPLLADSASSQASITSESLQLRAQDGLLETPEPREIVSTLPLGNLEQRRECVADTVEGQTATSEAGAINDEPGSHGTPGSPRPLPLAISKAEAIDEEDDQKQPSVRPSESFSCLGPFPGSFKLSHGC